MVMPDINVYFVSCINSFQLGFRLRDLTELIAINKSTLKV